jgi:hypothetical protein
LQAAAWPEIPAGGDCQRRLRLDLSLYKILQILSVTIFQKSPILEVLFNFGDESLDAEPGIQLILFDF